MIKLQSSSNQIAAVYTYDAWGKLLSVTDSSGNAITSATQRTLRVLAQDQNGAIPANKQWGDLWSPHCLLV